MVHFFASALISLLLGTAGAQSTTTAHPPVKPHKKPAKTTAAAAHAKQKTVKPEEIVLSSVPITVVFPPEGWETSMGPGELVYGMVNRPGAKFTINGYAVHPHKEGGYLTYVPVSPGSFTFHCELTSSSGTWTFDRTIQVAPEPEPLPGPAQIEASSLSPYSDEDLRPGDWLFVQMRATPRLDAEFQVPGKKRYPMAEIDPYLGIYRGAYQIQAGDAWEPAPIQFFVRSDRGDHAEASSRGRVSSHPGFLPVMTVTANNAYVKTGPSEGYEMFPPIGTPFVSEGRQGAETKVRLSPSLSAWIATASIQPAAAGTPPPQGVLGTIRTSSEPGSTTVHFGVGQTVPFAVEVDPDLTRVKVRFYYTAAHTNWVIYDSSDSFVDQVDWRQAETDVVEATVRLAPHRRLWGYHAEWSGGSFKLELRHPPRLPDGPVLAGRVIVLDPGHMPSAPGAVGPRGVLEMDVNLGIAKELEAMLKAVGAKPVMTRPGDEEIGLLERTRIAWDARADIFVSIHNNNLPDEANPFKASHGYSIFYYHPMSLDLARRVHAAYAKSIPLPDEQLRYGDLLVARITEMPSILTESAYMTYPEQEAMLTTKAFQKKLAAAIFGGLRDFLTAERARQRQ